MDKPAFLRLIKKLSYKEGDFTLASGAKSSFYVDLKNTTLHPEGAKAIGVLAVKVLLDAGVPVEGVGGLTLGADPIATAVSLAALDQDKIWPAFIVRKESKAHGTQQYIEGIANLKPGARLVVLEDVVTTGGSSLIAIERLKAQGFEIAAVLTVVDREQGGAAKFTELGHKFLSLCTLDEIKRA
jgi:orotate phosphoribosyltransferase